MNTMVAMVAFVARCCKMTVATHFPSDSAALSHQVAVANLRDAVQIEEKRGKKGS